MTGSEQRTVTEASDPARLGAAHESWTDRPPPSAAHAITSVTVRCPAVRGSPSCIGHGPPSAVRCSLASATPRRLCMIGLVVVYCSATFLAGLRWAATANAARAASWKPERMSFFFPGYVLISPTANTPGMLV